MSFFSGLNYADTRALPAVTFGSPTCSDYSGATTPSSPSIGCSLLDDSAPCDRALLRLMERTGYNIVQENGQRKFGGPPPSWQGPPPVKGSEVFVGKIPRDMFEDELVPLFETIGRIYEMRLMMDFSGTNRGYAFVMFCCPQDASRAVKRLNNVQVRHNHHIGVVKSVDNCRLFVGGLPRNRSRQEVLEEMRRMTDGVLNVIIYSSVTDKNRSRGFAFVEYENHKAAAMARRKLIPGRFQLWGQNIAVDWAIPEPSVDDDVMAKVSVLYVRNLLLSTSEETIRRAFSCAVGADSVGRVKKMRDFAFVHFSCRIRAAQALRSINGCVLDGSVVEVMWAKPAGKLRSEQNNAIGDNTTPPLSCDIVKHVTRAGHNRKLTVEECPSTTSTQHSPTQLSCSPQQVLRGLCITCGLGSPQYQVLYRNERGTTDTTRLVYICKVGIPGVRDCEFYSQRLADTAEMACYLAAEQALAQLLKPAVPSGAASIPKSSCGQTSSKCHDRFDTVLYPDTKTAVSMVPPRADGTLLSLPTNSGGPVLQ